MVSSASKPKPSARELNILSVLWRRGPSTVREVWDELNQTHGMGYTTILKLMQIMDRKHLVLRDTSLRAHRYEAAISKEVAERNLIQDLLDRVFRGRPLPLLLRIFEGSSVKPDELEAIRSMLDEYERRNPK